VYVVCFGIGYKAIIFNGILIVVVFAGMGLKFALAFFMPQITQIFTNYFI